MSNVRYKLCGTRWPVPHAKEGSTTVEFALVAPILIVLLFGIIEFGLMFKDVLAINQAAREGARSASLGNTVATVDARVRASVPTLSANSITSTYQYRTYTAGVWSGWYTLTDSNANGTNSAPAGAQMKVTVSYPHTLLTGGLFSYIADAGTNHITLRTSMVMRRE